MSVAFRAGVNSGAAGSVAGRALTVPGTAQINDIATFWLEVDSNAAVTPPAGWTAIMNQTDPVGGQRCAVWWHRLASGEPGVTTGSFAWTGASFSEAALLVWSGALSTGSPFSGTPVFTNSASALSSTYTGLTTADDGAMVVWGGIEVDISNTMTSTSGGTRENNQTSIGVFDQIQATAGATGSKNVSRGATNSSVGLVFALAPEPTGPPGVIPQTAQFQRMRASRQYL